MVNDTNRTLKRAAFLLLLLFVLFYSLYQGRRIASGPEIRIDYPKNGETLREPLAVIKGTAKNINSISMNGGPIFIDSDGVFEERLLLYEGYNIIKFQAKDRFGKETVKFLELMFENKNSEAKSASSTETASMRY